MKTLDFLKFEVARLDLLGSDLPTPGSEAGRQSILKGRIGAQIDSCNKVYSKVKKYFMSQGLGHES